MLQTRKTLGAMLLVCGLGGLAACAPPPLVVIIAPARPSENIPGEQPGDELPMDQVIVASRPATPLQNPAQFSSNRITLTARNADVRELLPALAAAAGVSLVMGSDVSGRVSVILKNVAAIDALRAVVEEADLKVGTPKIEVPFGPVVFYQLPVNINTASARTIKARFDVSAELSQWIVIARNK